MPRIEDEKVAQIEAALRTRFFPLVPKIEGPEQAGWSEEQHDLNRLSRALGAYSLVGCCTIDDATAAADITDGTRDFGLDAIRFDRASSRLLIVQAKYKRNGTSPDQEDCLKTTNGIKRLLDRRFAGFNEAVQRKADEIEEALDTPGVLIEVVMVYLGDAFNQTATSDLDIFRDEHNQGGEGLCWYARGLREVHAWLMAEQVVPTVTASIVLENWGMATTPRRVFYGQIKAKDLAQLVAVHNTKLFERNIRHYLGSIGVNTAIERTVKSKPDELFYLNNGITAIAEVINKANGTPARCTFTLQKISIVNGAQTAGAIAAAAATGTILPAAKLLLTIIEVGPGNESIGLAITRARNHQNRVNGVDFAALDPTQERLRQELATMGITYHYRPSAEARARRADAFTLEEGALAVACLGFAVRSSQEMQAKPPPVNGLEFTVTAKRQIGRLWEPETTLYTRLFKSLTGLRLWRLVQIYQFIDAILAASERAEAAYERRMFFRHGRYFIMAFIAHDTPDVVNKQELMLSGGDQQALSRRVNELSELIYATADALFTNRGYLAIFRNLTDAQPLADAVLQQLSLAAAASAA